MCDCERPVRLFVVFCSHEVCVCVCELALVLQDIPQRPMPKRNWHGAGLEASGGLQEGCPPLLCLPFTHTRCQTHAMVSSLLQSYASSFFHFCLLSFCSIPTGIVGRTQLHYEVTLTSYAPRQPGRSIRSIHLGSNGYRWQDLSLYRHLQLSVFFFFSLPVCFVAPSIILSLLIS